MSKTRVCVVGASGRLGRRVLRALKKHPSLEAGSALVRQELELPGPARVTTSVEEALQNVGVVVDFSAPAACSRVLPGAARAGIPYVLASTALTDQDEELLEEVEQQIPVVLASNFSVGVNLLFELVEIAARRLGESFDIEISEIHHRHKRDAPSGTALSLASAAEAGRGDLEHVLGRAGPEPPRGPEQLGIAALRGGDVAGEHTVYFFGDCERVELTHRATTPDIFAHGALRAAAWVLGKPPGRYSMRDVLGLEH